MTQPTTQPTTQPMTQLITQRMKLSFKRAFKLSLPALFAVLHAFTPAHAQPLTSADEKAVLTVVQSQLAAFAKDDGEKAFSFATPELRKSFGTAATFMAMVKSGYPVVYRPASVVFLKPESANEDAVLRVRMQDRDGAAWLAVYSLQRQKDKSWRISGCAVVENKGRTT